MPEPTRISNGMQVLTADGELLGTVGQPSTGGFLLRRLGPDQSGEETIPEMWVERVDDHVHLNRTGAEAIAGWKSLQFQTSSGDRPGMPAAMREDEQPARTGTSWLLWLVLAIVAIAIVAFWAVQSGNLNLP